MKASDSEFSLTGVMAGWAEQLSTRPEVMVRSWAVDI
jgi:hypothetical protein